MLCYNIYIKVTLKYDRRVFVSKVRDVELLNVANKALHNNIVGIKVPEIADCKQTYNVTERARTHGQNTWKLLKGHETNCKE